MTSANFLTTRGDEIISCHIIVLFITLGVENLNIRFVGCNSDVLSESFTGRRCEEWSGQPE